MAAASIASVAVGVGFYDQAHFTRQFRRHVGTSPGRYAQRRDPNQGAAAR
ncbi:MAG TPA: helix-turn-helix domain-containing protein [Actinomycetes bacterium]|nr:helix-turn-helix domain-containing protein [Actinomycetes bacterium]